LTSPAIMKMEIFFQHITKKIMLNTLICFCRLGKSNIASTVEGHQSNGKLLRAMSHWGL